MRIRKGATTVQYDDEVLVEAVALLIIPCPTCLTHLTCKDPKYHRYDEPTHAARKALAVEVVRKARVAG